VATAELPAQLGGGPGQGVLGAIYPS